MLAQREVHPHLQIFLVASETGERTPFIVFWGADHQLAAGPFPIRLLEPAGLNVFLGLSYAGLEEEVPSKARLRIKRSAASAPHGRNDPVELDQVADRIAGRRASKMFPDAPFIVIGHRAPSSGVLQVGNVMKEIQNKILACDKKYREPLETTLNSLKGSASYDHARRIMEPSFAPCS